MKTLNTTYVSRFLAVFCMFLVGVVARADQSQFVNAKLETRSANAPLSTIVNQAASESSQPAWIAYEVDSVSGNHTMCCGNHRSDDQREICGICNLEHPEAGSTVERNETKTLKLEGLQQVTVLLRVDQKRVMRIRVASSDCSLDAGGLRVVWLNGVKPAESVGYLTQFVNGQTFEGSGSEDLPQQALMALAQHADSSADRAFADFVAPNQPSTLREKAAFWLGASRGKSGLGLLQKMAKDDPSPGVREKVAFALFVSHEPPALDEIIRMAKDDPDSRVRGQALFWLAQKAGQKASATITGAIQNDPDTEVKKKAVFALSQMPKDEGVPKLIELAQNNKNPEVRKQAMFWLGQSNDPRALAFFERILNQ